MTRLRYRTCAALVGLITAAFVITIPASAFAGGDANCPHGANSTSSACVYGPVMTGLSTQFHNNQLNVNAAALARGYHLNESIWLYSGAPCGLWVETGVTRGYRGDTAYRYYSAFDNSTVGYRDAPGTVSSPDGSNHVYTLSWVGNQSFRIYRDGGQIGPQIDGLGTGACIGQTGLEASGTDLTLFHADTFEPSPLQFRDTAMSWHSGGWGSSWIDRPCGSYPAGNCLNGTFYGSDHWANNLP